MKKMLRVISVIMTVIMMFSAVAVNANGMGIQTEQSTVNTEKFEVPEIAAGGENASRYVGRLKDKEPNLNTFIFDNGDGTRTMELYKHPVKYVDADGNVKDITTKVKNMPDGSYKTSDNAIVTTFSKQLTDGINLRYEDVNITMKPSNSSTVSRSIITTTAESSDNKTVSYTYGANTTLEYTLTYTGVKEDIVVSKYTGQTDYHFTLYTNGLVLKKIADTYVLVDEENEIKATIGDIIIITADYKNNTMGEMSYTTVKEGSEYTLRLHIDKEYLSDSKTKYPIRIDPTITIDHTHNIENAIEDVTINSQDSSVGTSTSLYVGNRNTYGISRVLMKFPGLQFIEILHPSQITSATVELRDILGEADDMTVQCYIFNGNPWTENTASWSNVSPNSYHTLLDSKSVSYSNGAATTPYHTYSFNITEAVKRWRKWDYRNYETEFEETLTYSDSGKGIIFKANSNVESGMFSYINKTFGSFNRGSYQPKLTIEYTANTISTWNNLTAHGKHLAGSYQEIVFSPDTTGMYAIEVVKASDVTAQNNIIYLFDADGSVVKINNIYDTEINGASPTCSARIDIELTANTVYRLFIAKDYYDPSVNCYLGVFKAGALARNVEYYSLIYKHFEKIGSEPDLDNFGYAISYPTDNIPNENSDFSQVVNHLSFYGYSQIESYEEDCCIVYGFVNNTGKYFARSYDSTTVRAVDSETKELFSIEGTDLYYIPVLGYFKFTSGK